MGIDNHSDHDITLSRHRLFSVFDEIATRLNVQKVETAGDCYIVASGILFRHETGFSEVSYTLLPLPPCVTSCSNLT